MDFGKRTRARLMAAFQDGRAAQQRRPIAKTALAGLILGFGGVTAGTGLVQASERGGVFDFFGQLFGAPARQVEVQPPPEMRRRYSSLPDARRIASPRQRHFTPRAVPLVDANTRAKRLGKRDPMRAEPAVVTAAGPQSVCVRTCDGYMFPLGALASQNDIPLHQAACAAACPDAQTALYTLPWGKTDLDQIVSLKGQPYLAAAWANVYRQKRVENCHCRTPGSIAAPLSIEHDPTLRVGDVVATKAKSAGVVVRLAQGNVKVEDYRSTRSVSRGTRHAIDLRVGALQRDADERAFRRAMRTAGAGNGRIQVADASSAQPKAGSDGFGEPALKTLGFTPVRVLVPSPFKY